MKKIYFISLCCIIGISFLGAFYFVGASVDPTAEISEDCKYTSKLRECVVANKNGNSRSLDFICPATNNTELMLGQIILDEEFKKIDTEALQWVEALAADVEGTANDPLRAADDIEKTLGVEKVFYNKYRALCDGGILAKRAECTGGKVPHLGTSAWIFDQTGSQECIALVEQKLEALRAVAYVRTNISSNIVIEDAYRKYDREKLDRLHKLTGQMMILLGHGERLSSGITHYTPNPKQ